jgi:hypothetical protein
VKFREQRGSLSESLETEMQIENRDALEAYLRLLGHKGKVEVRFYGYDLRLQTDTCIVTVDGNAVGFTYNA